MPRKRKSQQSEYPKLKLPCDYVPKGGEWPEDPLVDNAPKEALLAQGIAKSFRECCAKQKTNANAVARSTGIGSQTVYNLRDGKSWPNLITIARLEIHFDRRLWGNEHKPRR